jgi:aldehyde:ferredoxin oxidoreductase
MAQDRGWRREPLLTEYYQVRGWDGEGRPTREKLAELGILGDQRSPGPGISDLGTP